MKEKYDGWVLKSYYGRNPFFVPGTFHETRKEVIEWYQQNVDGDWKKERRHEPRNLEIVKVKLVEVSHE